MQAEPRRPQQQDTFDLREQLHPDDGHRLAAHADGIHHDADEEEHRILEDDSEPEEGEDFYEEDDMSSTLSLQVVIYAEGLPEDAIPPYNRSDCVQIFLLPRNVTVAEVTEIGLEKFGIQDGVVDGGDEVEDKTTKRRSGTRVRYGLTASIEGLEKELVPSSKIADAYRRLPQYRNITPTGNNKRRSLDLSLLYGSIEDVRSDDPVFVIRRATSYRSYHLAAHVNVAGIQHDAAEGEHSILKGEDFYEEDDIFSYFSRINS